MHQGTHIPFTSMRRVDTIEPKSFSCVAGVVYVLMDHYLIDWAHSCCIPISITTSCPHCLLA